MEEYINIIELCETIFIHKKKYNLCFKNICYEDTFNILLKIFNKGIELLFKNKKELLDEDIILLEELFKNINIKFICKKYNSIYDNIYNKILLNNKSKYKHSLKDYYEKLIIEKYTYIIFFDEINK